MDRLGEMNTDNLEKMILRLRKWAQTKFRAHLKNLERQGRVIPTFKDVVNFLTIEQMWRIIRSSRIQYLR